MTVELEEGTPPEALAEMKKMEEKKEENEIHIDHEKVLGMIKQVEGLFSKWKQEGKTFGEDEHKKWIQVGNTELSYGQAHGNKADFDVDTQKLFWIDTRAEDGSLEHRFSVQALLNNEHPEKNIYLVQLPNKEQKGYGHDVSVTERKDEQARNYKTTKDSMEKAKQFYDIPNSENLTTPDQIQNAIINEVDQKVKESIGYIEHTYPQIKAEGSIININNKLERHETILAKAKEANDEKLIKEEEDYINRSKKLLEMYQKQVRI